MSNRYKHANAVPVAGLTRWVVVAFFLGATGLSYVYLKNQLHATGDDIRNLERQLAELQVQNDVVRGRISALTTHSYLQKKRADGFIHMVSITDDHIVRINAAVARAAGSDMRRVANEENIK